MKVLKLMCHYGARKDNISYYIHTTCRAVRLVPTRGECYLGYNIGGAWY